MSRIPLAAIVTTEKGMWLLLMVLLGITACTRPSTYPLTRLSGETDEQAALLQRLRTAECIDRMTSAGYSKNPAPGRYYDEKADDVRNLRLRLERGETPSHNEIDQALDTRQALQWSGASYEGGRRRVFCVTDP